MCAWIRRVLKCNLACLKGVDCKLNERCKFSTAADICMHLPNFNFFLSRRFNVGREIFEATLTPRRPSSEILLLKKTACLKALNVTIFLILIFKPIVHFGAEPISCVKISNNCFFFQQILTKVELSQSLNYKKNDYYASGLDMAHIIWAYLISYGLRWRRIFVKAI